jgi:hypothetical protein
MRTPRKYKVVFAFWCDLSLVIFVREVHVAIVRPLYKKRSVEEFDLLG